MKNVLLSLFGIFTFVSARFLDQTYYNFLNFKNKYNKQYKENELEHRYKNFQDNLEIINKHNSENHSWTMGINQFSDLTAEEFKLATICYKNYDMFLDIPIISFDTRVLPSFGDLPSEVDWTSKGAVTDVKDQGQCGSCWSFSTTGSVESAYYLASGTLDSFSEQQLVDCSSSYGNEGCNGGLMDNAFNYIKDNGICLEKDYPYKGSDGKCKKCKTVTKINSFVDIPANDEQALQQAVAIQPVSVAIEADQSSFQFYSGGVMNAKCGTNLDHGVLVVGYGTLNGKDYWKVKNSWGANWGQSGYILLARNVKDPKGQCGIAMIASYPVINGSQM